MMKYNLYVVYLFADTGEPAAPTVKEHFAPGENFCVRSPKIPGYTYDHNVITGIISPKRDRPVCKIVLYHQRKSNAPQETSASPSSSPQPDQTKPSPVKS